MHESKTNREKREKEVEDLEKKLGDAETKLEEFRVQSELNEHDNFTEYTFTMVNRKLERLQGLPDTYYIINLGCNKFLDTHGSGVSLWGDGEPQGDGEPHVGGSPQNLAWELKPAPGQPDTFYIVNLGCKKFLGRVYASIADKALEPVGMIGNGEDVGPAHQSVIQSGMSGGGDEALKYISWRRKPVPEKPETHYFVNLGNETFLSAHLNSVGMDERGPSSAINADAANLYISWRLRPT